MFDFVRGLPFPLAVAFLFVVVLLRAGGTYALGRAAHAGADRTRFRRLMASPRFGHAEVLIERWGAPIVVLSFLTVGFQTLVNAAAGLARMPLRRYLPALAVGGLVWALLYASLGFINAAGFVQLWQRSPVAAVLAGLLLVGGIVGSIIWPLRKENGRRSDTRSETSPGTGPATGSAADRAGEADRTA